GCFAAGSAARHSEREPPALLLHPDQRERRPVLQLRIDALDIAVAAREVHRVPAEHRHQLEPPKSGGPRFLLAGLQDHASDSPPLEARHDEHRADARSIYRRVEQTRVAAARSAAGIEPSAPAPAAASNDLVLLLDDEVCPVSHELAIEMGNELQ